MQRHLQRNSDKKRISRLLLLIVGVLLVGFLASSVLRVASFIVVYPVQQMQIWLAQSSMVLPVLWRDKIAMQTELQLLEQEVAELSRTSLTQRRLFEENNRLRSLLGSQMATRTLAVVVAKPTDLPYDLLQIDQGTHAGIVTGSPVYIGDDSVIGLVSDVYANHAFVTLLTTPDFLTTVFLSGANVTAKLEGLGGGVARVKLPQGIPMQVGDLVYVPSVQPGVYGQIAWVESEPTQPEQFGYITPTIPIASLYQVAVGQPSQITTDPEQIAAYMQTLERELLVVPDIVIATSTATNTAEATTNPDAL